jgi:broad specificity phosphatase PhoE
LTDIRAHGPLPALAVCHGGAIRVMLCWREGKSLDAFWQFEVPNTAVVTL